MEYSIRYVILFLSIILIMNTVQAFPICQNPSSVPIIIEDLDNGFGEKEQVQKGWTIYPDMLLSSTENIDDVEVYATMLGYEFYPISNRSKIFDMEANVTYKKKFAITLPKDMNTDDYKLRFIIGSRKYGTILCDTNYRVTGERHDVAFKDVSYQRTVHAGEPLLISVSLKNTGLKPEEGIRVKADLLDLQASSVAFIDSLSPGKYRGVEDLMLRIPSCMNTGTYTFKVEARFNELSESIENYYTFDVVGEPCILNDVVAEPSFDKRFVQPLVSDNVSPLLQSSGEKFGIVVILMIIAFILLVFIIGFILVHGFQRR